MVRALCIAVIAARIVYSIGCDCGGAVSTTGADSGASDGGATDAGALDAGIVDAGFVPILLMQKTAVSLGLVSGSVPLPSIVQNGDLLVVTVAYSTGGDVDSVQDALGNAFALAVDGGNADRHIIYYASGVDGGSDSIDITISGQFISPGPLIHVLEYQGIQPVSPLDQTTNSAGTSTLASASVTLASPNELIYAYCGSATVACADAGVGFRLLFDSNGDISADRIAQDAGPYSAAFPVAMSGPWSLILTSFRGF